jgi:hypothetical protein
MIENCYLRSLRLVNENIGIFLQQQKIVALAKSIDFCFGTQNC